MTITTITTKYRPLTRTLRQLCRLYISISLAQAFGLSGRRVRFPSSLFATPQPVLVLGSTGRVGRLVVQQLLAQNHPVRAVVRNATKAQEIFGTSDGFEYPPLEVVVADLGRYDTSEDVLERAVEGCRSIISTSGTARFSKVTDFLPWRLFRTDVSSWCDADRSHPYYTNYMAHRKLVDLASKHGITRFVRLTGLSVGLPAFSIVSMIFSGLLSMTSRYHALTEQYLIESSVPHVILRPGGLADKKRNMTTTFLQADSSGSLPPPARIGRSDVAALAIGACEEGVLPSDKSYTLAIRWVGDVNPRPQGSKKDGCETVRECLDIVSRTGKQSEATKKMKPYGLAVALFFYSLAAITLKTAMVVLRILSKILRIRH